MRAGANITMLHITSVVVLFNLRCWHCFRFGPTSGSSTSTTSTRTSSRTTWTSSAPCASSRGSKQTCDYNYSQLLRGGEIYLLIQLKLKIDVSAAVITRAFIDPLKAFTIYFSLWTFNLIWLEAATSTTILHLLYKNI